MRLIDADALFSNSKIIETPYKEEGRWWAKYSVDVNDIKEAPTIDVVPALVHCGECVYHHEMPCPVDIDMDTPPPDDWYCPCGVKMDGERKDGVENV